MSRETQIVRTEGVGGLYKGFSVSVAGIPVQQIYITVYEVARSERDLFPFSEPVRNGIAAFLATCISQLFNSPIDTISQVSEGWRVRGVRAGSSGGGCVLLTRAAGRSRARSA